MVLHLHGYIENRFEYETNGFKLAKKIVAVSKTVKEKWSNLYPEYSNKIKVIYNGVPVNHFKPQNVEKKYDLIYVGRLIKIKGLDYLIKAIKGLNLKVLIVGDGPERNKLQNLAERLNVNVKFLRYAKYEELPYIYSSSKIALFPSYSREGVLTSMLEAMACGVGIVTTDAGSMKEALERGGIIVRAKDVNSLRKGIKEALENYEELGKAARKNVIANFELRKRTRELLKFYKKLR
jgi:glycosyltransferase involved in cell wall biosynthesis